MQEWTEIRRKVLVEGASKRSIRRDYGVGWETLQKILSNTEPPGYRLSEERTKTKLGPYLGVISEILEQDRDAPPKQHHSAKRIFERLRDEHGYEGGITQVKEAVARHRHIHAGTSDGAELRLGGSRVLQETGGFYLEPTIFGSVTNDMRIAQEEIFGPVLSTISFRDPEEAVRIANDSVFGLAASVWTDDVNTAHRTARAIRAGVVWVNCFDRGDISAPFGGFKQSGFGRDKSIHAMEKFTDLKAIWIHVS